MRAGDDTRRRVPLRVSRRRYQLRRVTVILALTAAALAVINLADAVTTDGDDEQVAHAEPEQQILAAELPVDPPARPTRAADAKALWTFAP
jgi:hypothetical protein